MVNNAPDGGMKQKPKASYSEEEKNISLYVKAKGAIRDSLLYNMYHLVKNYESTQEMMDTLTFAYKDTMLTVTYKGTIEVQAT